MPAIDDTLTTEPWLAVRCGRAARTIWKMPVTLTRMMRSKSDASMSSQRPAPLKVVVPALFTSVSMRPQRSTVAFTKRWQSASSATLACTHSVSAPAARQAASASRASASLLL